MIKRIIFLTVGYFILTVLLNGSIYSLEQLWNINFARIGQYSISTPIVLLLAGFISPVIEEIAFRLPVLGNKRNFIWALGACIILLIQINYSLQDIGWVQKLNPFIVITVLYLAIRTLTSIKINERVNYVLLLILFAGSHNIYRIFDDSQILYFSIFHLLFFSDKLIGGLLYLDLRRKYGLFYGVLSHVMINSTPILIFQLPRYLNG